MSLLHQAVRRGSREEVAGLLPSDSLDSLDDVLTPHVSSSTWPDRLSLASLLSCWRPRRATSPSPSLCSSKAARSMLETGCRPHLLYLPLSKLSRRADGPPCTSPPLRVSWPSPASSLAMEQTSTAPPGYSPSSPLLSFGKNRRTPLHCAAEAGHPLVVEELLSHLARVDVSDYVSTSSSSIPLFSVAADDPSSSRLLQRPPPHRRAPP